MSGSREAQSWQQCATCGSAWPELDPRPRCGTCNGLLEVRHRTPAEGPVALRARFDDRCGVRPGVDHSGVWRFREIVMPNAGAHVVSHPEGNTPLLVREAVSRWTGLDGLHMKHEGHNPTGSFKDRGMTVGVTQAVRVGATAVACASTGNTSASLASYAALAGIPALVFVPAGQVALGKMAQTLAYGARTLLVRGDFDACLRLAEAASRELGVYLVNSINPYRLEGQKTIVLEMLQQLGWEVPDWIVLPAGNLGNTSAFGKALREARDWGLITRVPRLAAIQAEGAAPFARSFDEAFARRYTVHAETVATAIRIGDPASHDRAAEAIRLTDGVVTTVTDDEILEAKAYVDRCGVGCEPASAASVAGARKLAARGVIRLTDHVIALLTGHVLKDPGLLMHYHQEREPPPAMANRPITIDADLREVERVLAG